MGQGTRVDSTGPKWPYDVSDPMVHLFCQDEGSGSGSPKSPQLPNFGNAKFVSEPQKPKPSKKKGLKKERSASPAAVFKWPTLPFAEPSKTLWAS